MEKFYSKIVGSSVSDDNVRPITTVREVIMDTETGKLEALQVGQGRNKVIVPIDILSWQDVIKVHNHDSIVDANEVMRVETLMNNDVKIFKNRVESRDCDYLGRVYDFSIDTGSLSLKNLYVAKDILGLFRYGSRIIRAKDIVEILRDKIVVKADLGAVKEKGAVGIEEMVKV